MIPRLLAGIGGVFVLITVIVVVKDLVRGVAHPFPILHRRGTTMVPTSRIENSNRYWVILAITAFQGLLTGAAFLLTASLLWGQGATASP